MFFPPVPSPLVKSPPCAMNPGMILWNLLPLNPNPASPVHNCPKFSDVFGTSSKSSMVILSASSPSMEISAGAVVSSYFYLLYLYLDVELNPFGIVFLLVILSVELVVSNQVFNPVIFEELLLILRILKVSNSLHNQARMKHLEIVMNHKQFYLVDFS